MLLRRLPAPAGLTMAVAAAAAIALALPASARTSATGGSQPPPPETRLAAVSCPAYAWCMAVGSAEGAAFSPISQIETAGWRTVAAPERQADSELTAVSCTSQTRCVAVGNGDHTGVPFADAWNGTRWRLLPAFTVPVHAHLSGVSCPQAALCVAVGNGRTAFAANGALAELWNGSSWSRLATVRPAGATVSSFAAISCPDATHCLAVGQYTDNARNAHPLAESWNGRSWTLLPAPPGSDNLTGVSCPAASGCVVVGEAGSGLFSALWDGSAWKALTVPSPGSAVPGLMSVSCVAADSCLAVGDDNASETGPYALTWSGGPGWTLLAIPNPDQVPRELAAVSCPVTYFCVAVGQTSTYLIPDVVPLSELWTGHAWFSVRTVRLDSLGAVSCVGPSICLAAGGFLDDTDNPHVLAEAWRGHWLPNSSPHRVAGQFADVSCIGAALCMAVGQNFGTRTFVADIWRNGQWTVGTMPGPAAQISCAKPAFCLALGGPTGTELWHGTTWASGPAPPAPPGATTSAVVDVSCTGPGYCMAVGSYTTDPHGGVNVPLAQTWNGSTWKILRTPDPGPNAALNAVACVHRAGCMAVGNYADTRGHGHNLAMRWNGHRWTVFTPPGGFGYGSGLINGLSGATAISCPRLTACVAVGGYTSQSGQHSIALAWNGTTWRLTRPAGTGLAIADVFCPLRASCLAVGRAGTLTLAEHWNGTAWTRLRSANP